MGFFKKLFGLPDENDFDAMYEVKYVAENGTARKEDDAAYTTAHEGNFMFTVADTFTVKGRGTVVTGVIESGTININDKVTLNGAKCQREYVVGGIESFRKLLDSAGMGDNVGLLLLEASKEDICRGDKLYM